MTIREEILANPHLASTPGIAELVRVLEGELEHLRQESVAEQYAACPDMIDLMTPLPYDRVAPAYGLASFATSQAVTLEDQFRCKAQIGERTFLFSPVYKGHCFPLQARIICTNGQWWDLNERGLTQIKEIVQPISSSVYLGLECHDREYNPISLDGLQLYFQGIDAIYQPLLRFLTVSSAEQSYELVPIGGEYPNEDLGRHHCDREFLHIQDSRQFIAEESEKLGLLRLKATEKPTYMVSDAPPAEVLVHLPEAERSRMIWLRLSIPDSIPINAFANCKITTNVFPMWDVLKEEIREKVNDRQKITIPLRTFLEGRHFFALDHIWHLPQTPYGPTELFPKQVGTYQLGSIDTRKVGAIDLGKLLTVLESSIEQLSPDVLAEYPNDEYEVLQPHLTKLRKFSADWNEIRSELGRFHRKDYFLQVFPRNGDQILYINFFTTQDVLQQIWPREFPMQCDALTNTSVNMIFPPKAGKTIKTPEEKRADLRNILFPLPQKYNHDQKKN